MTIHKTSHGLLAAALCMAFAIEMPPRALAADTDAASGKDTDNINEIVVTARKRSEKLLDTPVAIVALSGQDIGQQGIYTLSDLAAATPGLTDDNVVGGGQRNDRSFPLYIIRGMNPSTTQNPTTTVFIDGAPIISGQVEGLDDLERVEVLEGPQSAYFGRETFAGAINLVTKDPSKELGGSANILAGDPNYYDARLSVEGSLIPDFLTARATYRYYTRSGSYRNEAVADSVPPDRLGDQSTQSESLELVATPVENFKVKALYMYWADRDGPSAQGFIGPGQANCYGGTWFCGVSPKPAGLQPAANTLVDAPLQAFLNALNNPAITGAGNQALITPPNGYGLKRDAYHWSIVADYDIPSLFTVSSISAVDNQRWATLQDLDNEDTSQTPNPYLAFGGPYGQTYYNYPFIVEQKFRNFSQELRLTSDQAQRFRWLVGLNYAWSRQDAVVDGAGSFSYFVPNAPLSANNTAGFYGLAFDVNQQITINFEGRYERDEQSTVQGIRGVFNNYTPRAILQYKFTPDIMGYVTFSEGVNPGAFNSQILSLSAADQQILASQYGAKVVVAPEKLKNYEIGLKGRFFDNSLEVSADVYHDIWTDQINPASVAFVESGAVKLVAAELNNGRVNLDGLESKVLWRPLEYLQIDASAAINKTDIKQGACVTCGLLTGSTDVNGNELPNVSKYQAALGVQYGGALVFIPDWNWFARVDDRYKSGSYVSADNSVRTPNLNFVNLRAGVTRERLRLEAFVDNLTNEDKATNLSLAYNTGNPFETFAKPDALTVGLPQLRSYGIRAQLKFGGAK